MLTIMTTLSLSIFFVAILIKFVGRLIQMTEDVVDSLLIGYFSGITSVAIIHMVLSFFGVDV